MIGWLMMSLAAWATPQGVTATHPVADVSVRAALDGYACIAARAYRHTHAEAESLHAVINAMIAQPKNRQPKRT